LEAGKRIQKGKKNKPPAWESKNNYPKKSSPKKRDAPTTRRRRGNKETEGKIVNFGMRAKKGESGRNYVHAEYHGKTEK